MPDTSGLVVVAVAITAGASLAGTVYTTRATRRVAVKQTDLEEKKVEADAYELAQSINRQTLDRLQGEIARIQAVRAAEQAEALVRVEGLEAQVRSLRELLTAERGVSDDLRRRVRVLERDVGLLRKKLQDNKIELPDLLGGSP